MNEYELEPWDSTSTMRYPTGKPMPGEAEGLGLAAGNMLKTGAQMLNPIETIKGIGDMASGVANDGVRLLGGTPRKDAPSFVGDIGNLAKSAYNQPVQTAIDAVTAPGSIPGMFTGALTPKIPKGTGWNLMRERPGFRDVRKSLEDVSRYDFVIPSNNPRLTERRRPNMNKKDGIAAYLDDATPSYIKKLMEQEGLTPNTPKTKLQRVSEKFGDYGGMYIPDENAVIYPRQRPNKLQKKVLEEDYPEWTPEHRKHTERHEDFHARREFLKPSSGAKEGWARNRPFDNWVEEANANMVGEKSISGGLQKWSEKIRNKDKDGAYVYDHHGDNVGRVLTGAAAKAASAARNPLGPVVQSAAPLRSFEEYEIDDR